MSIAIQPVSPENLAEILALQVAPTQQGFIETIAECLEEAKGSARWRPVGLYVSGVPIGFAMYGAFAGFIDEAPEERVWLDRFLIDARYQGQGYGLEGARLLIDRLVHEYACSCVYLSVYADNAVAIALYKKIGFRFNGETDYKGEKVMRLQCGG